jgi:hypothetical protein
MFIFHSLVVQRIRPRPSLRVKFRNIDFFFTLRRFIPRPTLKLEVHIALALRDC